jgi:exopolyphosphatase/guanosine-5'-triphosphate,3'-diphosphate pyrophosphatase
MLFCLRLAQVLCRGRSDEDSPKVKISEEDGAYQVSVSKEWAQIHPLTEFSLRKEAAEWTRIGRSYELSLK